jgi:hypothetical protein
MSATRSGGAPDHADMGSWATESLPMSVRKELLERELSKLGIRKEAAQGSSTTDDLGAFQQQADAGALHAQADDDPAADHAA